ncbi:MAG: HNH endonuclease [Candidatus Bathyarchaeia archaeon]|jgi:hypothetical protein
MRHPMLNVGDLLSYLDVCREEGVNLQRGMNFRLRGGFSVILMSIRTGAPYADRIEENGRVLIYEGHDAPKLAGGRNPKTVDQPMYNPTGSLTQNGLFYEAANDYKQQKKKAELVKVYEKIRPGIWTYNGIFKLVDSWQEKSNSRNVFKFKLELTDEIPQVSSQEIDHNRIIPASVKMEVWKRDKGACVICGSHDNLHFDHIIPYSKGGSSLVTENIQLLCARHNLAKKDKIE